ncbi:MAG: DNA-processing protein DprA [Endomicrobiia bacterium]
MKNYNEIKSLIILNSIPLLGPIRIRNLINHFGNAENVLTASIEELSSVEGININIANNIKKFKNKINPEEEIEKIEKENIKLLTYLDQDYPSMLKYLPDAPVLLYIKGNIFKEDMLSVAVVGTRKPTSYGRLVVEHLIKGLAKYNLTIISGLAYGIDTLAHEFAIKNNLRTIAVLGNGLGIYYPAANKKLQQKIPSYGALVSEFPYNFTPTKTSFPQRNRIIAALSLGTVVVEADLQSGAIITAKFALDLGKDVFAVPGSIFSNQSRGTNYLIKTGAKIVTSAEDIIEEIQQLKGVIEDKIINTKSKKEINYIENLDLSEESSYILNIIKSEPAGIHIDKLQTLANIDITKLMNILFELEIKSKIKELPGKIYISVNN